MLEIFIASYRSSCRWSTKISKCLNLGSYNYLVFVVADEYCTPRVIDSMKKYSPSTYSSRVHAGGFITSYIYACVWNKLYRHDLALGTTILHNELENCVADFVRKPAAIVFGMGYVTSSAILLVLMGKVCFIWWSYFVKTYLLR